MSTVGGNMAAGTGAIAGTVANSSPTPPNGRPNKKSNIEVAKLLRSKTCRVVSDFGEATGFFINDNDRIILTSFHLIGRIVPAKYETSQLDLEDLTSVYSDEDIKILKVAIENKLKWRKYLDYNCEFNFKTSNLSSPEELNIFDHFIHKYIIPDAMVAKKATPPKMGVYVKPEISNKIKNSVWKHFQEQINNKKVELMQENVQIEYDNEVLFGKVCFPEGMNKELLTNNYAFHDTVPIQITRFQDGREFSDGTKIINTGDDIEVLSDPDSVKIGEKVYFTGYPLTQKEYTFSVGMVSSIRDQKSRKFIVIEAPIVPGSSGGPVFVQREGKIYRVGVITSEIAIVSEEMLEIQKRLSSNVSDRKDVVVHKALTKTILENMSTGRGTAIQVGKLENLHVEMDFQDASDLSHLMDFLVLKTKIKKDAREPVLFQFFKNKQNGQSTTNKLNVTIMELHNYIKHTADENTRKIIFSNIDCNNLDDTIWHISIPVTADADPVKFVKNKSTLPKEAIEHRRTNLEKLYRYALDVGNGLFKNCQIQYTTGNTPIEGDTFITQKFFKDHIGGGNQTQAEEAAQASAGQRDIIVSTVINRQSTDILTKEIQSRNEKNCVVKSCNKKNCEKNKCIKKSFFEVKIDEIVKIAITEKKFIESVFFKNNTPCQVKNFNTNDPTKVNDQFFYYSVIEQDGKYYLHHLADSWIYANEKLKDGWIPLIAGDDSVYYKLRP